ncbi:MAG: hypothetical protein KC502_16100 [Myxococcales bacterium]|nr:hypothetical protein [Myxococcales bacterium]
MSRPSVASRWPWRLLLLSLVATLAGCGAQRGGLRPARLGANHLRVVTLNVARDLGLNEDDEPAMVVGTPANLLADRDLRGAHVVALQEVCGIGVKNPASRWLWQLGERLQGSPWQAVFVRNDPKHRGACGEGQLIAVRGHVLRSGTLTLPHARSPARTVLWVEFMHHGVRIRLWNLHLNGRANFGKADVWRAKQLAPVLAQVVAYRRAHPSGVALVVGDLNIRRVSELGVMRLRQHMTSAVPQTTENELSTHILGWPLDWIWVAGSRVASWAVVPLGGSDHHAVAATLALPTAVTVDNLNRD